MLKNGIYRNMLFVLINNISLTKVELSKAENQMLVTRGIVSCETN